MPNQYITCHNNGTISYMLDGVGHHRRQEIPATVWAQVPHPERERVIRRMREAGVRVTASSAGGVWLAHGAACGLTAKQAHLVMRAARARMRMRKGVAA